MASDDANRAIKAVKRGKNKAGTQFALILLANRNYLVYKLCANYDGKVRGGIRYNWRFVAPRIKMSHFEQQKLAREGMQKNDAEALYEKKIKGKQQG